MNKKVLKNQDSKKVTTSPKSQPSRKQSRKGENPIRISPITEPCSDSGCTSTWICRNSACRAVLSIVDTFCKRCSCCICHLFDDNKDPSLWLECTSDSPAGESCGLSCHIECALQRHKVGVVDLGQLMQLDGSYCCASCGKISGILGYWKKQLTIAKDSRRVDSLCYRIYVSFRLFDGTSRFQELHNIVKDAKCKLETEVGPLSGVSAKMARGIVSRLSVASEVQALCNAAIQKADEFSASLSSTNLDNKEGSVPAACKFIFEEVASSSVVLVLIELSTVSSNNIIGFKLWYSKTTDETHSKDPISIFPRSQRRILISNLQPCTEYSFRIVSYTENGADLNGIGQMVNPETTKADDLPSSSRGLDLNIATVPDLNEEVVPPNDSSRDEADHGSGGSENWAQHGPNGEVPAVDSQAEVSRKRPASTETHDCDSALINISSPFPANKAGPGNLDENFEYCVKMIRSLECEGYIKQEFRLKLLTWFSLRSTEQERRVVTTFIQTLADDPSSLAGQLVDSFADIINNKKPRNGFCSVLWH
ncbi:hypothetical protein E3N88_35788 [Mikania micrantha]|uniref:Fibronectin type-III domain-containing protein n=1 Tax=Mikania micrantha TaxID=192012 RepID=A0A5N6M297_9ASTR|nr:hypothetical protein E3N88_35788 [Mikania micrantha]